MPQTASSAEDKAALRSRLAASRRAMPDAQYRSASDAIVEVLCGVVRLRRPDRVMAYWPIMRNREVDIRRFITMLVQDGVDIVLPVVESESRTDSETALRLRRFDRVESLRRGRWGVYEPQGSETVPPEEIDMVIVPALALDSDGYRLGYGKGYYDRFLEHVDVFAVGPVFDAFFLPSLPHEAHDVPVDLVVSERRLTRRSRATSTRPTRTDVLT